jgi:hypothetical protein
VRTSVIFLALTLVGCIHAPERLIGASPNASPPDPRLVSSCENLKTWHNVWSMLGTGFSALSAGGGGIEPTIHNTNVQTEVAVGAAISGTLSVIAGAAAGIDADAYANKNCNEILSNVATKQGDYTPPQILSGSATAPSAP